MTLPDSHTHLSCLLQPEGQDFCCPVCVCSASPSDWNQIGSLAEQRNEAIIPSFGIHPWHVDASSHQKIEELKKILLKFPHAGIGEIGLDHTRNATASLDLQQEIFEHQIRLAIESNRVISVHCVKAWGRLLDSLEKWHPSRILIHGWKGPIELLPRLLALDCRFSIGLSTMEEQSILSLPCDRIMVESDDQCGSARQVAESIIALKKELSIDLLRENFNRLWLPNTNTY